MKKLFSLLLAAALLCAALPVLAQDAIVITDIQKYGNVQLSISGTDLLALGYAYGDIVTVTVNGNDYDMPVGSNFSDVEQGSMICRVVIKPETNEDYVLVAINMGDFATTAGIAQKEKIEADPGYVWHYQVEEPVAVSFAMKEQGGYYETWVMNQLTRSEKREDYPDLTDEQFANFRVIATTGVGAGKLYRSSSPVNPEIGRNTYADKAAEQAGVKTFINLADSLETMQGYEGFAESYYSKQAVIPLNLGVDFAADDFRAGLANGIRFIAENEAPFLVHCNEGKDRAGFVSAVLECLMGATLDEVKADYMVTFFNYYGVQPGTDQYDLIVSANIVKSLCTAFGLDTLENADLAAAAEAYLLGIGVTAEEIAQVRAKLGE